MPSKDNVTIGGLTANIQELIKGMNPSVEGGEPLFPQPELQQPQLGSLPTQGESPEPSLGQRIARAIALLGGGISEDRTLVPKLLNQFSADDRAAKVEANQRFRNEFTRVQAENQGKLQQHALNQSAVDRADAKTEQKRLRGREQLADLRTERKSKREGLKLEDDLATNALQRDAARAALLKNQAELDALSPENIERREHLENVKLALAQNADDLRIAEQNEIRVIEGLEGQVDRLGRKIIPFAETQRLRKELGKFLQGEKLERASVILNNSPIKLREDTNKLLSFMTGEDIQGHALAQTAQQMIEDGATPDFIAWFTEAATEGMSNLTGIEQPALDTLMAEIMSGEKGSFDVPRGGIFDTPSPLSLTVPSPHEVRKQRRKSTGLRVLPRGDRPPFRGGK